MYGPIGFYVTCDDAECTDCFETYGGLEVWHENGGFEDWDEPIALFPSTESDTPTHCSVCHELIPHALTGEGYAYVAEALQDSTSDPKVLKAWRDQYGAEALVPNDD